MSRQAALSIERIDQGRRAASTPDKKPERGCFFLYKAGALIIGVVSSSLTYKESLKNFNLKYYPTQQFALLKVFFIDIGIFFVTV
jgi:hypothetical protein